MKIGPYLKTGTLGSNSPKSRLLKKKKRSTPTKMYLTDKGNSNSYVLSTLDGSHASQNSASMSNLKLEIDPAILMM
jgi:hypothetical protein